MGRRRTFWTKYRPFKHWGRTEIPQDPDYKPLLPPPAQGDSLAKWFSAGLEIRKSQVQVPLCPLAGVVSRLTWVQLLGHLVNSQLVCLLPVGYLACYVQFEIFVSKV